MHSIEFYRNEFVAHQERTIISVNPRNLYDPILYLLGLGGKRLRPVLTLVSSEIFDADYKKALNAALAVEVFHNFSLVHDDIMDNAPLRRGQRTVHEKWDRNTALLSGDAMLIMAYRLLEGYDGPLYKDLMQIFSSTALAVCEGQQYDVDFESRDDVTVSEYLTMITYKTSVLLAAAMQMGAMVAGASTTDQEIIYGFGKNLGIAFQLQDDYLDAFGDPKTFGKQVGGDIIANKKTFLFLKAVAMGNALQKRELAHLYSIRPEEHQRKIEVVKELFLASGAADSTQDEIKNYTQKAFDLLEHVAIDWDKKELLRSLGENLVQRQV